MKHLRYLFLLLVLTACKGGPDALQFPSPSAVSGELIPVRLGDEGAVLSSRELFRKGTQITEVTATEGFQVAPEGEGSWKVTASPDSPPLGVVSFATAKGSYDLMVFKSQKKRVDFQLEDTDGTYKEVQIKGSFNGWNPANTVLEKTGSTWKTFVNLDPGTFQYLFVVDGKEMRDPANPDSVANGLGGFNSPIDLSPKGAQPFVYFADTSETGQILLNADTPIREWFVFYNNHRLPPSHVIPRDGGLAIQIPTQAGTLSRTTIRVIGLSDQGLTNDVFIPLQDGELVQDQKQIKRDDYRTQVLYFMLVDRFVNGDSTNDDPLTDPQVAPRANYHGGDLAGILQTLREGYFEKLGVNTLWLSPITQNPLEGFREYPAPHRKYSGYHGYWPIRSGAIDHRFGTDAELKELVEEAHRRDMNVILDFVSNHVHEQHPLIQQHPEYKTQFTLEDGSKNIRLWDEQRLTTWFDEFLPSLDFSNPEVIELQSDSAVYWIRKFGLDGFRHDATKHVPLAFWKRLSEKLREEVSLEEDRKLFQIGETFGSRELIGSYVATGMLDGQFDFNLYFDTRDAFARDEASFTQLANSLRESMNYYGAHSQMGNITGNHDLPRFISYADGSLKWDEDAKEAGWNRDLLIETNNAYRKQRMLNTFILTIPGVPVIYYGDEYGEPGGGDPDNRHPMRFGKDWYNEEFWVNGATRKLVNMRRFHLPLMYGDTKILEASDNSFVYARIWRDEIFLVAFNKGKEATNIEVEIPETFQGISFNPTFEGSAAVNGTQVNIQLDSLSSDVFLGRR